MRQWEADGLEWPDETFQDYAQRAFELQFEAVEPYRRYCERRGVTPAETPGWTGVPPVPVAAFRRVSLIVGGPPAARLEFLTSGTTAGAANRGRHLVREPALYRASMEAAFLRLALRGEVPTRFASLVPPFSDDATSSLAWMIDGLIARFGGAGSGHFASAAGVDLNAASEFAARAVDEGTTVCVLATTLALDAWTRHLRGRGERCPLPPGSLVMDTGGSKGRDDLSRGALCRCVRERLGTTRIVNEFGMTELLSQLYSASDDDAPWLHGPPWLRVRALDPNDLAPLPDGEAGLLCYFDLANLGSVSAVLTEDVGRVSGRGVQWLRRFPGTPPRGCSLATAELLAAQEASPSG